MSLPDEETLASGPLERHQHFGHGFRLGIGKIGQAFGDVVEVDTVSTVFSGQLFEVLPERRTILQDQVKINEVLPASPSRNGGSIQCPLLSQKFPDWAIRETLIAPKY